MALPTLTPEQRAQALEKAAASRRARAALREELKTDSAGWTRSLPYCEPTGAGLILN